MKRSYTLAALPVLACGIVLAGSTQASARHVDPDAAHRDNVVVIHDPGKTVKVDDTVTEGLQTAAGAIGGAGLALATVWAYRRRHPLAAH